MPTDPAKRNYLFSDDLKFLQKAIVMHPDGKKLLALKRSMDDTSRPGKWDLPGGNVQYGEEHMSSLLREIKEESGLQVHNVKPIHVWTNYQKDHTLYHIFIAYRCDADSAAVVLSSEHTEYRWITPAGFLQLESADYLMDLIRNYSL